MQCVILAGGLGLRMRPLTEITPKALIPVEGRPFADYQLRALARQGVCDVVYCIGHKGSQIVEFVGDGAAWGLKVRYSDEGDTLLGTAGALRVAFEAGLLADNFFVLYGDSYLPIDFRLVMQRFELGSGAALMTVLRNEDRWDRSNVIFTPPRVELYDKHPDEPIRLRMKHIDYGLSVLPRGLVRSAMPSREPADLAVFFNRLSRTGKLSGYEVSERFFEVGSLEGLADFTDYVRRHEL